MNHDVVAQAAGRIQGWFRSPDDTSVERSHAECLQRVIDEGRDAPRSAAFASLSLEQALCRLRDELTAASGARLRIFVTGQPAALAAPVLEQIYLIGREALINALRHSDATSIEAEVGYMSRQLCVVVRDNGCGIDQRALRSGRDGHWGLLRMRERAESLGARLRIWSRPGAGTEVELSVSRQMTAAACA